MANISSDAVQSLINYLSVRGLTQRQCIEQLKLSERQLRQKRLIDTNKYQHLYQWASTQLNSNRLGFEYGQHIDSSRWGVLGQIAYTSANLEQAITYQTQYQTITGSLGNPSYAMDKGKLTLYWTPAESYSHHIAEELLTSWVAFARNVTATNIKPIKVWFSHQQIDTQPYADFFNCPVEFNKSSNGMALEAEQLKHPILSANADLNKILRLYANSQLSQFSIEHPVAVARDFITSQLPQHQPNIKQLAAFLNSSERTLQRRLSESDTSFSQLIDDCKKRIAINYMLNTTMSIESAAELLGFSEQSAFNRAFKRWTNMPPAKYREHHQVLML